MNLPPAQGKINIVQGMNTRKANIDTGHFKDIIIVNHGFPNGIHKTRNEPPRGKPRGILSVVLV
jgi:hypothetical protein